MYMYLHHVFRALNKSPDPTEKKLPVIIDLQTPVTQAFARGSSMKYVGECGGAIARPRVWQVGSQCTIRSGGEGSEILGNMSKTQGPAQDGWSVYIFFNQIHYFMVKITTFFYFP
jgi:hypothetical protein